MLKLVLAMDPQVRRTLNLDRLATLADVDLSLNVTDFADPAHTKALAEAEILFTHWGCRPLTEDALDRMPALRSVIHAAGSVKHHITDACWSRGLAVSSAAAANAVPVAEFTLAAILFAGKRVNQIAARFREERSRTDWATVSAPFGNHRLTVGIVGASLIGRRVVELLRPFDFSVRLYDPYLSPGDPLSALQVDLDDLAASSDIISIHAPETPETLRMFDARRLALLRDGATLINTARGSLVDTRALTGELVTGRLHAVLDVTEPEILPATSPLYDLPNVLLTPHLAGSLGNELTRMTDSAIDEVARLAAASPLAFPVRPEALAYSA